MRLFVRLLPLILLLAPTAFAQDHPEWTTAIAPFRIADNLFYVGSQDLASFLVTTPAGNILINTNLETSPPQIRHSVEQLGFRWADTKILLNGQAHFDHMAGAAQVLRETHAKYMVMDGDVSIMESGGRTDFDKGDALPYPPAHVDRLLHDGDKVEIGGVVLIAHKTPGHTRGCTTWTFRVHVPGEPAGKLRDVVIVGGVCPHQDYRLAANSKPPALYSYPGMVNDFRHTFSALLALPCDIFLGAHGAYFNLSEKQQREKQQGVEVWVDPAGYKAFIEKSQKSFESAVAKQQAAAKS